MKKVVLSSKEAILVRSLLIPLARQMYRQNKVALYDTAVLFDVRLSELRSLLHDKFLTSFENLNG